MSDYQPSKVIPGTVYQVIRLLGQGGMGTVYEVEDTTVGKRYVLKTLHAQLRDRKELAVRLNKEARVLARLSHPNIVEVVTAGMTGDSLKLPYFVMQKLNGHTLRAVLTAKGCLPAETAYSIAIDLLDALDHAHALGVIHRDVKPENIFLHRGPNESHQTKLLDFGVMRMLSSEVPETGARFVGTLRYAPPEQLRGGPITPRTDLYAAGLVLYEMLAGDGPFDEETTDRGIANAHLERAPPLLSSRASVSPELERLVMSALAKDPALRPKDAFTFAARLRELGVSQPRALSTTPDVADAPLGSRDEATVPMRPAATTTGAISSNAETARPVRRAALFAAIAIGALAALGGALLLGARSRASHPTSATAPTSTPAPTAASTPVPVETAPPATIPIPTPNANPNPNPNPAAHPRPAPQPRRPAAQPATPSSPPKPRLPGPGF